jgi:hypothetical protein
MRLALALTTLAVSSPAFAGGFGIFGVGGVHTDTVYFYDAANDLAQYRQNQTLPNYGGGMEFVLGDRDDKITGIFRGYFLQDAPQQDPAKRTESVAADDVVANVREEPRNIGAGSFGIQWGFLGSPDKLMATAITAVGSGFLTDDHTEFMMLQVGGGATYRLNRNLQVYGDIEYTARMRKQVSHGANGYVGVRYLFD